MFCRLDRATQFHMRDLEFLRLRFYPEVLNDSPSATESERKEGNVLSRLNGPCCKKSCCFLFWQLFCCLCPSMHHLERKEEVTTIYFIIFFTTPQKPPPPPLLPLPPWIRTAEMLRPRSFLCPAVFSPPLLPLRPRCRR